MTGRVPNAPEEAWLPSVGQWIGGIYRLERLVGSGGIGMVFAARDASLDRAVAIKVLKPDMASRAELRDALVLEARRLANVRHPHVVTMHACGTHRGYPYVVMELVEGTNALDRLRADGGHVPIEDAVRILSAVADGLDALHARDVVHGDVKPSNVLLGAGGRVKLTDVGFGAGSTEDGAVRGTLAYLAPERIVGDHSQGRAGDVYAFGVTAYQLLTGHLPHGGQRTAVLDEAVSERHRPASAVRSELPVEIDAVIDQLLARRPADRPASVSGAMTKMQRILGLDVSALPLRPDPPRSSARRSDIKRLLVADDDSDLRQMLSVAVASVLRGCVVEGVGTGDDALSAARYRMPDAVVLDLQMPGTPTPSIARAIRNLPGGDSVPIIAVTGSGSAADWRELKAAGADACLLKPFDANELVSAIERHAARRKSAA